MSSEIWLWVAAGALATGAAVLVMRPLARAGMGAFPAAALAVAPAALAFALYIWIGRPGLPDMPLGERAVESAQHQELLRLAARLEARLETSPDDARGWRVLAATWRGLGRTRETAEALARAVQAEGGFDAAPAGLLADYGEARATASGGMVTPEALGAFHAALRRENGHPKAWHYLALERLQAGDEKTALALWRGLEAAAGPDAPWLDAVRNRVRQVSQSLGPAAADIAPATPARSSLDGQPPG